MARDITKQESVFAEHYVLTRNGRQSAILAGYSETNASGAAHRLLKRSRVVDEIKRLETVLLTQTSVTRDQMEAFYLGIIGNGSAASIDQKLKAADLLCKLKGFYRRDLDLLLQMDEGELTQWITRTKQTMNVPHQIIQGDGK